MMEIITHADWDFYTYEVNALGRTFFITRRTDGTWHVHEQGSLRKEPYNIVTVSQAVTWVEARLADTDRP